jgi:lipopolysaccharide/colanic/teichoic acid biosynthesis glycosyltransferase
MKKQLKIANIHYKTPNIILNNNNFNIIMYNHIDDAIEDLKNIKFDVILLYSENIVLNENILTSLNNLNNTHLYLITNDIIKDEKIFIYYSDIFNYKNYNELFNKLLILHKIKNAPLQKIKPITYTYNINPNFIKRSFDIIISLIVIILLSPIFIITMIIIYFEDKSNIFYNSKRVFSKFRIYYLYKFRTMITNADSKLFNMSDLNEYDSCVIENDISYQNNEITLYADRMQKILESEYLKYENSKPIFHKLKSDPRVTKIGEKLRSTSIDELPQLFNILKGHMSIVGNRPLPIYEAIKLTTDDKIARFLAPAGLTGLWQIKKQNNKIITQHERIELDNYYAQHRTFLMDLLIIFKTFKVLLHTKNN